MNSVGGAAAHDGRFAPSPTGELHLGSLRTALVAWLAARSQGARFLVRVEDLDPDRLRPEMRTSQLHDLAQLGIDWDDEPIWQSRRAPLYEQALARLAALELVYPCFCTRADIRAAASAPHGPAAGDGYPGTCARLGSAQAAQRVAAGEAHCLRFRAAGRTLTYSDRIVGKVRAVVDDFVVRRKDGVAAYNLAVVVDDADQGIGQVVRGDDLAPTTPRQLALYEALALPTPTFAHVPLVLGPDGSRLAKRHGAVSLADLAAGGIDARDVLRMLAGSLELELPHDGASAGDLVAGFTLERIPRAPVIWDGTSLSGA